MRTTITLRCAYTVALCVEQAADLHEVTLALGDVLVHGRLKDVGVLAALDARDALWRVVDEHRRARVAHEVPHAFVRVDR